MALSSKTLPAWCAAASGTGTRLISVAIPNKNWTFAIANAAVTPLRIAAGKAARMDGMRHVWAYSKPVQIYVVVALRKREHVNSQVLNIGRSYSLGHDGRIGR